MSAAFRGRAARVLAATVLCSLATTSASAQGEAESLSASFRGASRRAVPAVVTVRTGDDSKPPGFPPDAPFGRPPEPPLSGGSGVVIDAAKGYVLTNDHLVQQASRVVVILHDGRERPVTEVRRDPKSDLALLIIPPEGLSAAGWGDSEALDTGDWVLAIGHPFGLSVTVTAGIVSGKGRGIGMAMYEDLIQTDAAINPGNSGGPLVNLKGEVVGINTAIKTLSGGYEGIGFAIPAARARRVAADLAATGKVRRAYVGIQIGSPTVEVVERLKQPGAVVVNGVVSGGPAATAGLKSGDLLLEIDGKPVEGPGSLQAIVEVAPIGRPLTFAIERAGERKEVPVSPQEQPEAFGISEDQGPFPFHRGPRGPRGRPPILMPPRPPLPPTPPDALPRLETTPRETGFRTTDVAYPELGLRLSQPTPPLAERFRIRPPQHGLVIVAVDPDGPSDRGGLEPGMVLTAVGNRDVESIDDLNDALEKRPDPGGNLVVRILRGSKAEFRVIPREAGDATKAR